MFTTSGAVGDNGGSVNQLANDAASIAAATNIGPIIFVLFVANVFMAIFLRWNISLSHALKDSHERSKSKIKSTDTLASSA